MEARIEPGALFVDPASMRKLATEIPLAGTRYTMIRLALAAIAGLGLDRALASRTRGEGVILTFHHVSPDPSSVLPENAGLSITPGFLDATLALLRQLDYDIIPLDGVAARLENPVPGRPFAVLTFDDGYRDNRDHALPVLKRHAAPFTLFVCAGFAERSAPLWWLDLEDAVMRLDAVRVALPDGGFAAATGSRREKLAALRALYWRLRQQDEPVLRGAVAALAKAAGVDPLARVARLCMAWDELRAFAAEPLAGIGAHSLSHPRLARLDEGAARYEMAASRARILAGIGIEPRHFAYPVGDAGSAGPREFALAETLGFEAAVTTVPGVVRRHHAGCMTALPRISVNGLFQEAQYLRALISGVPFALKG